MTMLDPRTNTGGVYGIIDITLDATFPRMITRIRHPEAGDAEFNQSRA